MYAYNFAIEWQKDPWTKIDFDKIPLSGLTNEGQYNSVCHPSTFQFPAVEKNDPHVRSQPG